MRAAPVLLLLAGAACSRAHDDPPAPVPAPAVVLHAPPTTSPSIALSNLHGEIADREKRAATGEVDAQVELVPRYEMRARFEGRVTDLVAADDTSARLLAAHPGDPRAHLARAVALSSIHAFAGALQELDEAARLKAEPTEVARERSAIFLATGREDEARALLPPVLEGSPPSDTAMRAGVEARCGNAAESERLFELARASYHDVSPFTMAWMDFERARALELGGDRARARAYLEEAVTVLPGYVHASVHLASLEAPDRALVRLEVLGKTSDDPDVLAGQADALRRAGRADEATAMAARARARFEEVLARLPLAYADHAASFYLGSGRDAARALELARTNARNRPTDEALELWLTAAQAAASSVDTCDAAAALATRPHAPGALRDRAAAARRGCP
jgi:tetratricopeptide (TPR) repeat protein